MAKKSSRASSSAPECGPCRLLARGVALCIPLFFACAEAPSTIGEYLEQGDRSLAAGDVSAAIASYRLALHQDTLNPVVLARLSKAYAAQKKPAAAERYLRHAMNITYEEGMSALQAGDDSAAAAAFERTLRIFPRHPLALNKLGDIYLARGEQERALRHYEQSSQANPHFAETWVKLGRLYLALERKDQAKRAFLQAIEANMNEYRAYLALGQLYLEEELWMDAAEQFDKALLIDPHSTAARAGMRTARRHL